MTQGSRLPLNTLTAFRAVAEVQNLRAAAETLNLTHSAVSQQIRGLEEQLGFALFERRGRRVVLNPAGHALLRSVQGALALLDDGVQAAPAAAGGEAQRLRVTVLPPFANRWPLPPTIRGRQRHPSLTHADMHPCRLVYPPGLRDWPSLVSLRDWLFDELDRSLRALRALQPGRAPRPKKTRR